MTLRQLEERGGVVIPTSFGVRIVLPDGSVWEEIPSPNGEGWYAGNCNDMGNLCFRRTEENAEELLQEAGKEFHSILSNLKRLHAKEEQ